MAKIEEGIYWMGSSERHRACAITWHCCRLRTHCRGYMMRPGMSIKKFTIREIWICWWQAIRSWFSLLAFVLLPNPTMLISALITSQRKKNILLLEGQFFIHYHCSTIFLFRMGSLGGCSVGIGWTCHMCMSQSEKFFHCMSWKTEPCEVQMLSSLVNSRPTQVRLLQPLAWNL